MISFFPDETYLQMRMILEDQNTPIMYGSMGVWEMV